MKTKLLIMTIMLLCTVGVAQADTAVTVDNIKYTISGESAKVTSYVTVLKNVDIRASVSYDGKDYPVTSIGEDAFYSCSSLTSVTIPNSVTSIGKSAFYGCEGLTSVTIPGSVTSIADGTFWNCKSLTSVTIPGSVISIGEDAFYNCMNLISVTIPDSVISIGKSAFCYCYSLTSVTIPGSVTSIGAFVFKDCTSLKSIEVSSDNKSYSSSDGVLFDKAQKTLIAYPAGRKNSTYAVPNTVTRIENSAFQRCRSLTSVTILGSVTDIGWDAFYYCSSLTSMTFPYSVTSIESNAFYGCKNLGDIYCLAQTPPALSYSFERYGATLHVSKGCMSAYKAAENWKMFTNIIEDASSVVMLGGIGYRIDGNVVTVASCNSNVSMANVLASVEYDAKACPVVRVGESAFKNCSELTSITLPVGIYDIGEYAFKGCSYLVSMTLPVGVLKIGKYAFQDCYRLPSLILPSGTTEISEGAFSNCSSLTSITISNSVTEIGERAFEDCSTLTDIICCAMIPPFIAENTFDAYTAMLHVPIGSKAAYKRANYWKNFTNSLEEELSVSSRVLKPSIAYANGILSLPDTAAPATVYVYAQDGKCVWTCPMAAGEQECDLSRLAQGIYLVRAKVGNETTCLKIVR